MHNIISEMKTNRRRTRSSEFSACLLYQSQRMKISIAERSRDYFWWCLRESSGKPCNFDYLTAYNMLAVVLTAEFIVVRSLRIKHLRYLKKPNAKHQWI